MKCAACQTALEPGSKFCVNCGATVAPAGPPEGPAGLVPAGLETRPSAPDLFVPPAAVVPPAPVVAQVGSVMVTSTVSPPAGLTPGRPEDGSTPQAMPFGTVMVNVTLPPLAPPLPPPAPERVAVSPPEAPPAGAPGAPAADAKAGAGGPKAPPEAAPGGGKSSRMVVVVGVVLVAGAAAAYFATRGASPPAPSQGVAAVTSSTAAAPSPSPATPTASPAAGAKEVLNQLITAGREDRWPEVNPTVGAIKALARPPAGDAGTAAKLQQEGDQALKAGNFDQAIAAFERARSADPSSGEARLGLATAQVRAGRFDLATGSLVDALLASPESGAAWLLAAENFAELDKAEASLACLKLAVYLAKDRAKALAYLQDAPARIPSAKFKAVISAALPNLKELPGR